MEVSMQLGYRIYDMKSASHAARPVLEQVKRHYQFIPNALGAMVESPEAVRAYLTLDELIQENSFTAEQRHVVFLTIAREFNCSYCVAAHTAFAQMGQVEGEHIQKLRDNEALSDSKLNALQRFVSKLVQSDCHISEKDLDDFLAQGFTRCNVLEVITMMANKLIAVYANRVMGTDLDEALQPLSWKHVA